MAICLMRVDSIHRCHLSAPHSFSPKKFAYLRQWYCCLLSADFRQVPQEVAHRLEANIVQLNLIPSEIQISQKVQAIWCMATSVSFTKCPLKLSLNVKICRRDKIHTIKAIEYAFNSDPWLRDTQKSWGVATTERRHTVFSPHYPAEQV